MTPEYRKRNQSMPFLNNFSLTVTNHFFCEPPQKGHGIQIEESVVGQRLTQNEKAICNALKSSS
jgi:hypothetical protein